MHWNKILPIFGGIIILLATGFFGGFLFSRQEALVCDSSTYGYSLRDTDANFAFIKPLLTCNTGSTLESSRFVELKGDIEDSIRQAQDGGVVEIASVYIRELDSGDWTGVNMDESYSPASLMKLPIFMAHLKQSESVPELLQKTITIGEDPTPGSIQDIPPQKTLEIGETYTVETLLQYMMLYSDNRATQVLLSSANIAILDEVLEDLAIPVPDEGTSLTINAREYSRFFRLLYNDTYLRDDLSEYALEVLSRVDYDDALAVGVPSRIAVAHKFGEASVVLADGIRGHELHDCGIIYAASPYVLCVMTRGKDVDQLQTLIAEISGDTYTAMNGQ